MKNSNFGEATRVAFSLAIVLIFCFSFEDNAPLARSQEQPPPKVPSEKTKDANSDELTFEIVPNAPMDHWLDLEGTVPPEFPSKRLLVRIAPTGSKVWLLPVYLFKDMQIVRTDNGSGAVVFTLYDALYHPQLEASIHKAMTTSFAKTKWEAGTPLDNHVSVAMWVKDEKGRRIPVAESEFTRDAEQRTITIRFDLDVPTAERLTKLDRSRLGLTFSETYQGRFKQTDLDATLTVASTAATAFQNKLDTNSQGERATLLVAIGGSVNQKVSIQQMFSRQVTMELMTRNGKEVNQTLLDSIVGKLFSGVQEENSLAKQSNDTVVTFLTSNGLKATASIGTFKGLKDQWKTEVEKEEDRSRSTSSHDKTKVEAEVEAKTFLGGGKVRFDYETERDRSESQTNKLRTRDLRDVMKAIEGELPVAVLNGKQMQTLATHAQSDLKFSLGTFSEGRKLLIYRMSLQAALEGHKIEGGSLVVEKSETEIRREALAATTKEIKQKRAELDAATKARDEIAADNKPREERLAAFNDYLTKIKARLKELEQRDPDIGKRWNNSLNDNKRNGGKSVEELSRLAIGVGDKQGGYRELRLTIQWLEPEAKLYEADMKAPRLKLATANATIVTLQAELKRLEAKRNALEELLKVRP